MRRQTPRSAVLDLETESWSECENHRVTIGGSRVFGLHLRAGVALLEVLGLVALVEDERALEAAPTQPLEELVDPPDLRAVPNTC